MLFVFTLCLANTPLLHARHSGPHAFHVHCAPAILIVPLRAQWLVAQSADGEDAPEPAPAAATPQVHLLWSSASIPAVFVILPSALCV